MPTRVNQLFFITQPHIFHEIAVKHGLAHLLLIILSHIILLIVGSEASNSSLVEHLILAVLGVHIGQHVVDS